MIPRRVVNAVVGANAVHQIYRRAPRGARVPTPSLLA